MLVINILIIFAIGIISYELPSITELKFNKETVEQLDETEHYYYLTLPTKELLFAFIQFSTIAKSRDNTANFFISKTNQFPSFIDSDYHTYTKEANTIIISKDYYEKSTVLYIGILCDANCEYTIIANQTETMFLQLNKPLVFSISGDKKEKYVIFPLKNETPIFLYATSPSKFEFEMKVSFRDSTTGKTKNIPLDEIFDNGYGIFLTSDNLLSKITIKIKGYNSTFITMGCRELYNSKKIKTIHPLEIVYGAIKSSLIDKECFTFVSNESDHPKANYLINILSFTEDIWFSYSTKEETSQEVLVQDSYSTFMNSSITNEYKLCFNGNPNQNTKKLNASGYTFQIINSNKIYESQLYIRPLINGRPCINYLPQKTVIIHRLEKRLIEKQLTEIFVKQFNNNNLTAYGVSCHSLSECQFTAEKIQESKQIIRSNEINDILQVSLISMNPLESNLYIAIVYCNSTKVCKYSITMKNKDDIITLSNHTQKTYYKTVIQGEIDKFFFRHYNPLIQYIYIVLFSFTGKGHLMLYDNIAMVDTVGDYNSFGTKETYIITKQYILNKPCNFYITVSGISSTYYSITVFEYEDNPRMTLIPTGEIFLEHITSLYSFKTLKFHTNDKEEDHSKGFLITVSMINCNNVRFKYKEDYIENIDNNNVQFYFEYNGVNDKEEYEIIASFIHNNLIPDYISCQLFIAATGVSPNQQILLSEGFQHVVHFVKSFSEITYNYPYFYVGYEENLIISITANGLVEYSYSTDQVTFSVYMSINDINKLPIPSHQLEKDCFVGYICSIIIKIRRKDRNSTDGDLPTILFSIQVTATNMIPIYIQKKELRLDHVFEGNALHYYTEIQEKEEGEIMVNFLRGSGYAIAKIVYKNQIEEDANWNNRVHLPDKHEKNRLPNNYFENKINYNETHTIGCSKIGCELYLTVFSTEEESTLFSTFSILIRQLKSLSNPVIIEVNNYYFGTLESQESNKYLLEIIDDYESIFFDFNSEICLIRISENLSNEKNKTPKSFIYNSSFTLKASDFYQTTLKSLSLIIEIFTNVFYQYYYSYKYNLRIIPPISDSQLEIIELDYIQNRYCDIKEKTEQKYCRYVVKIHDYDYLTNNLFVAFHSDPQRLVKIYASRIKERDYNRMTRKELEDIFPTPTEHEVSSNNSTLLSEPNSNAILSNATYALVTVESPSQGKIQLVSNWGHFPRKTLLISNTLLVFYISKNKEMEIIIQGKEKYQVEIVWLTGAGFIEKYPDSGTLFKQEINSLIQSINILINPIDENLDNIKNIITIKSSEKGLGFSIYYSLRGPINLDQAKLFLYSSFFYDELSQPPLYFYTQIYSLSIDVITNINIDEDTNIQSQQLINYSLKTFLIENDTLFFTTEIDKNNTTSFLGEFNSYFRIVYCKVRSKIHSNQNTLDNYSHYLINELQTQSVYEPWNIKLKSLFLTLQLTPEIPLNETKPLPYNTFLISTIDNKKNNEFVLSSYEDIQRYMEIELISFIDKIEIKIIAIKNDSNVLSPEEIKTLTNTLIEKKIINLQLLIDEIGVKVELKANVKDQEQLKYALRYKISPSPFYHCKFKSNALLIEHWSNNWIKITFANIQNENNQFVQTKFDILFFNYSVYDRNLSNSERAMLLLTDTPFKKYSVNAELNKSTIQYNTKDIQPGKYYVSVIGITNHYFHEELFQYNVTYIELTVMGMQYLWIIIVVVVVVIGFSIIGFCWLNRKNKRVNTISGISDSTFQYQTITNTINTNTNEHSKED